MQNPSCLSHCSSPDSQPSRSHRQAGYSSILIFSVLALLFILTGCLTPLQNRTVFFLALHPVIINSEHDIYRHFMTLEDPGTKKHVNVQMQSLLNSSHIEEISIIPPKDNTGDEYTRRYGLRLYPDHVGQLALREIMGRKGESPLAIIVDGFLVGTFSLDNRNCTEEYLELPPLWSLKEAKHFVLNAEKNREEAKR